MQEYRIPTENKTDKVRRLLWVAFILSATISLILAFCSRQGRPDTFKPGESSSGDVDSTLSVSEQLEPTLDDTQLLQTRGDRPGYKPVDLDQTLYFLLIGLDKWEVGGNGGKGLTDTIIVAFLDNSNGNAGLISIPRDTWVEVPKYGFYKINQAYLLGESYGYPGGGPGILMETASNLLDIEIDYYAQVDYDSFVALVDAINGVPVDVQEEISIQPNANRRAEPVLLTPGEHVLPGDLALGYVRTRDTLEGDFGRTKRQQQVLVGLQKKLFSFDVLPALIPRMPELYRKLSSDMETNLTLNQIVSLAWAVKHINPKNVQTLVIKEPIVTADINERNQYILVPDLDQIRKIWGDMQNIAATPIPEPTQEITLEEYFAAENASLAVLNATSSPGLANVTAEFLEEKGFRVSEVGNADSYKDQTLIYDYSGKQYTVQSLLFAMGYTQNRLFYRSDPSVTADIVIVLGTDWVQENPMDDSE
jgi:LCP family protein required for cell wall assembly